MSFLIKEITKEYGKKSIRGCHCQSLVLSNLCCVFTGRHVDVAYFQEELHLNITGKARKTTSYFYRFSDLAPASIETSETSQLSGITAMECLQCSTLQYTEYKNIWLWSVLHMLQQDKISDINNTLLFCFYNVFKLNYSKPLL